MFDLFDTPIDRTSEIKIPKEYHVERLDVLIGKRYLRQNHYSKTVSAIGLCYGLYDVDTLIGVIMFSSPCSERVRASVLGNDEKQSVIELHRLHVLDVTPRMTESWFIGKAIRMLKKDMPNIKAIISFADTTQGHEGIIYKATNFKYEGQTPRKIFYQDEKGRIRHPRQSGKNIKLDEALSMGWKPIERDVKNRYVLYLVKNKEK